MRFTLSRRQCDVLGLAASVACVLTYLVAPGRPFDWANATLWPFVILPAVSRRSWPSLFLPMAFGLFGFLHLLGVAV